MKRAVIILISLSIIIVTSCSSARKIIKLEPQSKKTKWFYGQEFTGDSVFGIIAKVAFDEVNQPWYTFDVEITNRSNMSYLVDPAKFFIIPFNEERKPLSGDTIFSVDPEAKIMELDKSLSINAAKQKNKLSMYLIATGIDVTTGIVALSDDNPRNDYLRTDMLPLAMAADVNNKFEAQDLNELRNEWKSTTLSKTTLEKGFSMHGKLLVPVSSDASYVQLNIPVDNDHIRIDFTQIKYSPNE